VGATCRQTNGKKRKITHGHFDHCLGVDFVAAAFPRSSVRIAAEDEPTLFDAFSLGDALFVNASTFAEGDVLRFGNLRIEVAATLGHSPGSVVFILSGQATVFSGDTLFRCGVGRTDLPGGDVSALRKSIREKLFVLPDGFSACLGHGEVTTVGAEKGG
jgi:glyoxylase-like metal-dependent hydrolase (beta-lactamase superfamily II)